MPDIANRYAAVFNEPDPGTRRTAIAAIWSQDARVYTPAAEYAGLAAIEERVRAAHEKWVRDEGFVFRPLGPAEEHHGGVRFRWEMIPAADGPAASAGAHFLVLDADGLIRHDYQFIDL